MSSERKRDWGRIYDTLAMAFFSIAGLWFLVYGLLDSDRTNVAYGVGLLALAKAHDAMRTARDRSA